MRGFGLVGDGKTATVAKLTKRQLSWIRTRDDVGETIDRYLSTKPTPELRAVVEALDHCCL